VKISLSLLIATMALCACSSQTAPPPGPADQVANAPEVPPASDEGNSAEEAYTPPEPQPVVSIYEDQPDTQPPPIEVDWAPPPMLVEPPPPPPQPTYFWTGGYWGWHGRWVWVHGRWAAPPRPGYRWQQPYYDHRGGHVVFVGGFWARPGVEFVVPAAGAAIALAVVLPGVIAGPPPTGPEGVFIPPPPGSRPGLIVPAFVGCPSAVVIGAPPLIRPGMRVTHNHDTTSTNTVIDNTTINNVTIIAPAGAVATHVAVNTNVPAAAHLAAAQTPVVRTLAPQPATTRPLETYSAAHSIALPAAQSVRAEVSPQLAHPVPASADLAAQHQQIEQQRVAQAKAAEEQAAREAQARQAAEAAAEANQKATAAANAERSQQQAAAETQSKQEADLAAERNRQQAVAEEAASKKKAAEEAAAKKAAEKNHQPQ
jgi:hypothetical protein